MLDVDYEIEFTLGAQTVISGPVGSAPVTGSPADWKRVGVSLNYLRNLGLNTAPSMSIGITGLDASVLGGDIFPMALDNLAIDETFTASTPNFPVNKPAIVINCGTKVYLNLGALPNNGSNSAVGYHIYRAPGRSSGSPGAWTSMLYTTSTTYTDNSVATGLGLLVHRDAF